MLTLSELRLRCLYAKNPTKTDFWVENLSTINTSISNGERYTELSDISRVGSMIKALKISDISVGSVSSALNFSPGLKHFLGKNG